MRKVYSPRSESELVFLQSVLQAHDVPHVIDQGGFGAALPRLYVDHYTQKWIKVPEAEVERARTLVREHLSADAAPHDSRDIGWLHKLRIVAETLLFGWFVPGRRGNGGQRDDAQQRSPDK